VRGMGSGLGRSSRWGRLTDYVPASIDHICLLVQIETSLALRNVEAIAATPGVDGVLFGPADLAANLGYPEQRSHPDVIRAIKEGIALAQRAGTPSGIMITDIPAAQEWLRNGISFAGVGVDSSLLIRAADDLLAHFRTDPETPPTGNAY
jgi:4-hydroxy-2-oxoheptanedioate aldolase